MTFNICLHEVCVRVGGQVYATPNFPGWIVYQILLPMVLGCARFSRARAPLLILPLELQYMYFIEIKRKVYSHQISSIINLAIRVSGSLRCHSGVIQVLYKNPAWVPCMFLSVLRTMQHTLLFFLFITTVTHGCRNRWKFQLKDSYLLHEYLQMFVIIVYVLPK